MLASVCSSKHDDIDEEDESTINARLQLKRLEALYAHKFLRLAPSDDTRVDDIQESAENIYVTTMLTMRNYSLKQKETELSLFL